MNLPAAIAATTVLAFAPPQEPVNRPAEQKLVHIKVSAVDSHGEPITDLTAGDFQISDAGKAQEIAFFQHRDSAPTASTPLARGELSNRMSNSPRHATVILFDLMNERLGARGEAWDQMIKVLQPMKSADDLYLYLLANDGRIFPVRGFSGEQQADRPEGAAPWTTQIKAALDGTMRMASRVRPPELDIFGQVELTLRALGQVALEMSRVPGGKSIVWVTNGLPSGVNLGGGDMWDFTTQLRRAGEALAGSGIALYPVQQSMIGLPAVNTGGSNTRTDVSEDIPALEELSGLTGGHLITGKDIGNAIKDARNDQRTSYLLGYYPQAGNWDGKLHKLRITSRHKGVRLHSRTGYYAWPEPVADQARREIEAVAGTPFEVAQIGLRASVTADASNPELRHFRLHIDADDVALPLNGRQYVAELLMGVIATTGDGRGESAQVVSIVRQYSAEERDKILKEGIELAPAIKVGANVKTLRFIFCDTGLNGVGSITIPVSQ